MISISVDGEVTSCSNDFYLENRLGNVNQESLVNIFTGKEFVELRRDLLNNKRQNFEACRKCDYQGVTSHYDYQSVFRPVLRLYNHLYGTSNNQSYL